MSKRQTLSLLIPAYNAGWCLPRLLESAHKQTIPFDQIWVYDDCSTDDTASVAERFGAKVLRGSVNVGCSAGKNILTRHVDTDWIHFHDADDELLPHFVEEAQKWINQTSPDVILFSYEYRDNNTGQLIGTYNFNNQILVENPIKYAIERQINPFCGLYKRHRVIDAGGYDEDPAVLYNEDVAFHIRLAFNGLTFAADNKVSIINYRVDNSMSAANKLKCAQAHFHVMEKTLFLRNSELYKHDIGKKLWFNAGVLAALSDWTTAKKAVLLASQLVEPPKNCGKLWFRLTARLFPYFALVLREIAIRTLKPTLRHKP